MATPEGADYHNLWKKNAFKAEAAAAVHEV